METKTLLTEAPALEVTAWGSREHEPDLKLRQAGAGDATDAEAGFTGPDVTSSSDEYARRFRGELGRYLLRCQRRHLLNLLSSVPGQEILDVGGGHAHAAVPLSEQGYRVTVLGSAPCCEQRLQKLLEPKNYRFEVGSVLRPDLPDRSYDTVVSLRMMAHVQDPEEFLGELCRMSRRAVVFDFSNRRSLNAAAPALFRAKAGVERNTRPFFMHRPADVADMLNNHGYRVTGVTGLTLWPLAMHRLFHSVAATQLVEALPQVMGLTRSLGTTLMWLAERKTD